ncbi:unnamed protein product [Moneuplotes crassus]|uniref:Uncharacterized protein n=1 Tax=Euplotes crassus TaxID=5936 RepID=A0AAD1UE95_EUPCR|nr:unnamed protein product [Moneuplotes crassus]
MHLQELLVLSSLETSLSSEFLLPFFLILPCLGLPFSCVLASPFSWGLTSTSGALALDKSREIGADFMYSNSSRSTTSQIFVTPQSLTFWVSSKHGKFRSGSPLFLANLNLLFSGLLEILMSYPLSVSWLLNIFADFGKSSLNFSLSDISISPTRWMRSLSFSLLALNSLDPIRVCTFTLMNFIWEGMESLLVPFLGLLSSSSWSSFPKSKFPLTFAFLLAIFFS